MQSISIIGSGFSSLSAACYLAKKGNKVRVYEKNDQLGGRARILKHEGFTFDMGPSWYWMPDLFDKIYDRFGGRRASEFYERKLLDPAYRIFHKVDVGNKDTNDNTGNILMYRNLLHGPSCC